MHQTEATTHWRISHPNPGHPGEKHAVCGFARQGVTPN